MAWVIFIAGLVIAFCIYFLPSAIARKKPQAVQLFLINLLLGWTVVAWFITLIWAFKKAGNVNSVEANINAHTQAQLKKLSELTMHGALSDEEFEQQKARLLGNQHTENIIAMQKKLQLASAAIMVFVMLVSCVCYFYVVPKYIYGEEATARRFLNSLQANFVNNRLMQTNYLNKTGQNEFKKITSFNIKQVQATDDDQFIVFANVTSSDNTSQLSEEVGIIIQKNYDEYKITDTYNLLNINSINIVFPDDVTDLQKTEAIKTLYSSLQVVNWQFKIKNNSVHGTGIIKNNLKYPVKHINVDIKYANLQQKIINADTASAIGSDELSSGESRTFTWYTSNCNECNSASIYIRNSN